jgi:predicted permease
MRLLHAVGARIRLLFDRQAAESRMDEEMQFHIEMEVERLVRERGLDAGEAQRQARVAFGGAEKYREELRDGRGLAWLMGMSLDFRLGFRMLRKYPGLTLVSTLALAFAVAVGAFGFEVIRQLANPTLPFEGGDRIVGIRMWNAVEYEPVDVPLEDFATWREGLRTIEELGVYATFHRNLATGPDEIASVNTAQISASAFRVAGVKPQLGRGLLADDEEPGAPSVLVIGHDVWQARFGGDPNVIGRAVRHGDTPVTVVGVMPEGFGFPYRQSAWMALPQDVLEAARREGLALPVFGRLSEGVTLEQAWAELASIGARMAVDFPATHEHLRPLVRPYAWAVPYLVLPPLAESWVPLVLYSTNLLFVLFLALIAANVAALVFARTASRESEIVVRNALGASRRRLVTQLFVEALVLGAIAAPIGLAVAAVSLGGVMSKLMTFLPFWFSDSLSTGSVMFGLLLAVIGSAIAGIMPGLKVTRQVAPRLRQLGAGGGGLQFGRGSTIAIVSQVAVTIVFVAFSLYATVMAAQIRGLDVGFPADEYLSVRVAMDRSGVAQVTGESVAVARTSFTRSYEEFARRLSAEPGVLAVTYASRLPGAYHERLRLEVDSTEDRIQTAWVAVNFFDALGTPIVTGRGFRTADVAAGGHVAVVNPSFVQHVLDGRSAVGRHVRIMHPGAEQDWSEWHEIIGVVEEIALTNDPELPHNAGVYFPIMPAQSTWLSLVVHIGGNAESFAPRLHTLAASVDPSLQLSAIEPLDEVAHNDLAVYLYAIRVLMLATGLALLLSLASIYAVMSFAVAQRTREIGIRLALGANPRRIVAATLGRHMGHAGLGVLIGVAFIVLAAGGVPSARTAAAVGAFTMIMLLVIMLAAVVPVRRALRIQPARALKGDG